MTKQKRVVNVISKDGKLFAIKNDSAKSNDSESVSKLADACIWIAKKKDAYGVGILGLGIFGLMMLQALFIGLFSYFWYGKDIDLMLGFIGYLVTLDILSFVAIIPVLGTIVAFFEFFYWDAQILAFFGIPDDCLTLVIKVFFLISMIVANVVVTMLVIYWRMNKEAMDLEHKFKFDQVVETLQNQSWKFENLDSVIAYRKADKMAYKLLLWSSLISGAILILIPIVSMIYNQVYVLNITEIYMLIIGVILLLAGLTILILMKTRSNTSEETKKQSTNGKKTKKKIK